MAEGSATSSHVNSSSSRYDHLKTLFDQKTYDRITNCSLLVVGAGGIGCELLKNLVCTGFGHITIVDLDTVDTSNLNRQFLFQKKHVKKSKAIVARETASTFNPNVTIHALHASIMDPQFNQTYYKKFDLVLNALDNLAARRHVNKMCVMTKVPLVESGTAGYKGQVQPIRTGEMECYDCQPKPLPTTYPVCTIRSTPSTAIHCIVWAKSYLFPQLFGPEDENEGADLDEAVENEESVQDVDNWRAEVKRMKEIRAQLDAPEMTKIVFTKVFEEDIKRLCMMEDMWQHRTAPIPLIYDQVASQNNQAEDEQINKSASSGTGLKDQQTLSLKDSFDLFCSSLVALGKRIKADPRHEPLRWDKDDEEALDFVTAAANLRANVFGIPNKTRFEVKEMAGNIIPAIATTNSAISALIVFQAINILSRLNDKNDLMKDGDSEDHPKHSPVGPSNITACRPWYNKSAERIIMAGSIDPPNPHCEVCPVVYSTAHVNPDCTLEEFMKHALKGKLYVDEEDDESITIQEGDRLLYDPDFTDNKLKTFKELNLVGCPIERALRITDEAEKFVPLLVTISENPASGGERVLVEGLPDTLPNRPPPPSKSDPNNENYSLSDIEQVMDNDISSHGVKRDRNLQGNNGDYSKVDDAITLINDSFTLNPRPGKKIKLDNSDLNQTHVHMLD